MHNYVNGAANKLSVNDKLHATGDIKLINDEANVEIVGSGSATNLVAANITLQSQYDVIHNGGTITATDKVFLEADGNILLQSGAMQTRKETENSPHGVVLRLPWHRRQKRNRTGNLPRVQWLRCGNQNATHHFGHYANAKRMSSLRR